MSGITTTIRGLAVGAVLAGCAIGLAGPASAELTDGTYTLDYIGHPSDSKTMVVISCGDGCKHMQIVGADPGGVDFHLQGNTWTGLSSGTVVTIDNDALGGSSGGNPFSLTKVG
jgi:hypothetical protein